MRSLPSRRAVVALLAGALVVSACRADTPVEQPAAADEVDEEPDPEPEPEPEPEPASRAPLSGLELDDAGAAALAERPLLLTKVENSPQASPQAGLELADVVIEELVEGGITRFMALFHSQLPDDVGPVRSARPVDVAVGSGFGAPVFAYSGARGEVQTMLRDSPMILLEEGASGVRRVSDRRAPHNVFIRPDEILAAGIERGASPLPDVGWVHSDDAPDGGQPADGLTVPMSTSYRTGWTYDTGAGVYRRDQNGQATTVTGAGRIGAANVVVLATRHYTDGCCDTNGAPYAETDVVGEDEAIILRDGQRYAARWRKPAADQPLELLDVAGEPFPLKPGPTWIMLPSSAAVGRL